MTIEENLIKLFENMAEDPRFGDHIKQSIDDECVGFCKVAELQQELDECRKRFDENDRRLDRWINDYIGLCRMNREDRRENNTIIDDLNSVIECLEHDLSVSKGSGTAQDLYIAGLKKEIVALKAKLGIADLDLHDYKDFKQSYDLLTAKLSANVEELSVCKHDSEVLMRVVDVVKRWNDHQIASRPAMNQVTYILKNHFDTYIIVDVNSKEDVQPIVEKIAKSVAARIDSHVNAQVKFATPNTKAVYLELP